MYFLVAFPDLSNVALVTGSRTVISQGITPLPAIVRMHVPVLVREYSSIIPHLSNALTRSAFVIVSVAQPPIIEVLTKIKTIGESRNFIVYHLFAIYFALSANGPALDLPGGFIARSWSERLVGCCSHSGTLATVRHKLETLSACPSPS